MYRIIANCHFVRTSSDLDPPKGVYHFAYQLKSNELN